MSVEIKCRWCGRMNQHRKLPCWKCGRELPAPSGSALAELARNTSEAFRLMEQEQAADYQDYVRRCGGSPISKIPAPGPQEPNDQAQRPGTQGAPPT